METITKNGRKYKLVPVEEPKVYRLTKTVDIEIHPENLPVMTWKECDKYIKENHAADGWRMPTLIELRMMYEAKDEIGGFITEGSGSVCPQWYWSCTELREDPTYAWSADFSDGYVDWDHKDGNRLSCRLVRLVPVAP